MKGEWSCYRGGQFTEGRMVVIEVASNGGGMAMLQRLSVSWSENGCYKGNLFNGGEWSC